MSLNLFEIACEQHSQVRALASRYVACYGADALPLARMARADVVEHGKDARAALYTDAIELLAARATCDGDVVAPPCKMRMTITGTMQVLSPDHGRSREQQPAVMLHLSAV